MSNQRTIFAFFLLASVCLTLSVSAKPKDVIVGTRQYADYRAHHESIKKDSRLLQVVTTDRTFGTDGGEKITQLRLLDQNKKNEGATATITAGGPGYTFVTVHFKSTRGHGIDFVAEIYGKH